MSRRKTSWRVSFSLRFEKHIFIKRYWSTSNKMKNHSLEICLFVMANAHKLMRIGPTVSSTCAVRHWLRIYAAAVKKKEKSYFSIYIYTCFIYNSCLIIPLLVRTQTFFLTSYCCSIGFCRFYRVLSSFFFISLSFCLFRAVSILHDWIVQFNAFAGWDQNLLLLSLCIQPDH